MNVAWWKMCKPLLSTSTVLIRMDSLPSDELTLKLLLLEGPIISVFLDGDTCLSP